MKRGMICRACGVEAPSQYVKFYQNIGALVMRFNKSIRGNLCKRCIHKYFWKFTLTDISVGWLGTISLFVAPVFAVNNIVRYIGALGLPAPSPNAVPPQLTQEAIGKLGKYTEELGKRLNNKESFLDVTQSIARSAGVTPGQVELYVRAMTRAAAPPPDSVARLAH